MRYSALSVFRGVIGGGAGLLLTAAVAAADPRTDYILHCQGCHRADGSGTPSGVPSFRGQLGKFVQVPGGREYLVRVPGTSQSELSDARIAALLNWMLRELDAPLPATFVPFTTEEVSRSRRPPLTDVESVRELLLRAMGSPDATVPARSLESNAGPSRQ